MDLEKNNTRRFAKERVLRFKPIAFIRKYIGVFVVLLVLGVSFLFGLWNISKYEIFPINCEVNSEVESEILEYLEKDVLGRNIFVIESRQVADNMFESIPYIKSVSVEKEIPNKLTIFVEIHGEKVVASLSDGCHLLSSEGYLLNSLCTEEDSTESCCSEYSTSNEYIYLNSGGSTLSTNPNGKQSLLVMRSMEDVISVVESYDYSITRLDLKEDILEVSDIDEHLFVFDMNDDVELQLKRFLVVMGKVQSEDIVFESLDLRFERPVVRN